MRLQSHERQNSPSNLKWPKVFSRPSSFITIIMAFATWSEVSLPSSYKAHINLVLIAFRPSILVTASPSQIIIIYPCSAGKNLDYQGRMFTAVILRKLDGMMTIWLEYSVMHVIVLYLVHWNWRPKLTYTWIDDSHFISSWSRCMLDSS